MDPKLKRLRIFLLIENTGFTDGYLFLRIWYDKAINEFVFRTNKKGWKRQDDEVKKNIIGLYNRRGSLYVFVIEIQSKK